MSNESVLIRVTQAHIDAGLPTAPAHCPVASVTPDEAEAITIRGSK